MTARLTRTCVLVGLAMIATLVPSFTFPPAPASESSVASSRSLKRFGGAAGGALPSHIHAAACLVGLLRAGEQSAEQAFARIAGRLSATQFAHALPSLRAIAADEARHDRLLARAAGALDGEWFGLRPGVQRFFLRLESRDPRIHLSRIASLDGAVCQLLSAVLSKGLGTAHTTLPHPVLATLVTIRADEGRHVRIARALARELGQDAASFRAFDLETRLRFSDVLGHFDWALATLGLDTVALRGRIRRDDQ